MEFLLNDIHTDLAQTVDGILDRAGGVAVARAWAENGDHSAALDVYRQLAEAGITGLLVPDEIGGSGAGAVEMVAAVERLGYGVLPGPVAETFAVVPAVLGAGPQLDALLGGTPATCALPPVCPRATNPDVATPYLITDDGVFAATPGELRASVDPTRRVAELSSDEPPIEPSPLLIERSRDLGALATAAQLIGLGSAMLDLAADYAKSRKQFGREIGSFQAVKHHLADVAIAIEMARPLVHGAAVGIDGQAPDGTGVGRDVSAAKVAAGDAAHLAYRHSLQVLGAIGYTAEHDLSLYLTKTRALLSAWGTPAHHRARILETL
ncbi:acyl-CoA/acyl-ACP dehydrogenase [Gordonia sp. HY002]|uniref:acyl-CoA dehydrogenase family protein n=1 Tax=Gordonia zhenghanii TaxID=2911516 RepID=UPI001EEF9A14|nr:acyl-CoA dehydrogenase family protein [Gordonia zhenghanii]MCF8568949.1 acyl-CoA/acyl-ACP dehydrogenase [Gordonia zhenghanii]MCF8603044.1 acyl-CoA/acyl-ACP dehydrogenase [Gordonia zhenghanii]